MLALCGTCSLSFLRSGDLEIWLFDLGAVSWVTFVMYNLHSKFEIWTFHVVLLL